MSLSCRSIKTGILLALCLSIGNHVVSPVQAAGPSAAVRQAYLEQLKVLKEVMAKADDQLFAVMQYVAGRLVTHYHWKGHMPGPGWDQESLKSALAHKYSGNPYFISDERFGQVEQTAADHLELVFIKDPTLSEISVAKYKEQAPSEWRAKPGTIVVITGDSNLALVWGANAEGLPLRVRDTGRPRFLILRPRQTW